MSKDLQINTIIDSGKLEQYVVGAGTVEERFAMDQLIQSHPELEEAYNQAQQDLFNVTKANGIKPPDELRDIILKTDGFVPPRSIFNEEGNKKPVRYWYSIAATFLVLIAVSSFLYSNYQRGLLQDEVVTIKNQLEHLNSDLMAIQDENKTLAKENGKLASFSTDKYVLKTDTGSVQAVIFHSKVNDFAEIKVDHLNPLDKDHDYQLWADVNGEMISLAVLDTSPSVTQLSTEILYNAESINLTVEKAGGSDHATVANLVANVPMVSRP